MAIDGAQIPNGRPLSATGGFGAAYLWRLGWLAAVFLAAGAAAFTDATSLYVWLALAAGGVPALAALAVGERRDERLQSLILVLWATCGAGAAIVTGGVSGAMSAWILAPVAAASTLSSPRRLAEGASLALIGGAVAALTQLSGLAPAAPEGPLAFILGFLSVATVGVGLASGLILTHRVARERDSRHLVELNTLQTLVDGAPQLLLVVNSIGRIKTLRGVAPRGVGSVNLVNEGLVTVASAGDRQKVSAALAAALEAGEASVSFAPLLDPARTVSLELRLVSPALLVGVMRDATVERARETALQQARAEAESLAAGRARFLANMSHELRTPLNAIMGFSDIMRARMFGPLTDRYGEYAELIHESGRHLLDLINDVLDMSKIEAERFELTRGEFDAREAVTAAMRLMRVQADAAGVQLRGVLPPGELEVDADRRALKQIVLNLVSNALKFTPRGGQVTVTADGHDGEFELVVADTGVGISPEDLERLGRPYEQAGGVDQRAMGTGLGLSLVRAFAKLHGGEMHVESRMGAGTSVSVRMPVLLHASRPMPATLEPMAEPEAEPELGPNVVKFAPPR
ncbi:sensor histidine kinase [Caulobacter sp. DWR2-3-1b2]|uniref:cell cycle sensor histidine kinase DivJ n=1 Tax=unclassified Caulobacter TaxID=2648921 RepID=UPI003CFAEF96